MLLRRHVHGSAMMGEFQMRILAAILLAMSIAFSACNEPGNAVLTDVAEMGDEASDTGDTIAPADVLDARSPEVGVDILPEVAAEVLPDVGPACLPGEGCFLDPCDENADCQSGWCVDHLGESVCSQDCMEDCPEGWICKQVAGTDPDIVFICVSNVADLCKPCVSSEGCDGGVQSVCLDYGDEGSFCGAACDEDGDCPWGFVCQAAMSISGVESLQCIAETGTCPCTAKSIELALSTPCETTNEWGTCTGQRVCAEEGLTDCDAKVPAEEICNGLDDNCDGDIDEAIFIDGHYVDRCDDDNPCTQDLCTGEGGCENVALSGDECVDGDPCTVMDQCQDGICTGTPVVCDDENPCTDDACVGDGGCQHLANTLPCDDADPCTVGDHCSEGECAGEAVNCDCQTDADCA